MMFAESMQAQSRERVIGHMNIQFMELKELQSIELEILKAFHNFCEQHHLKYYLAGGTLLGAIRHKGFIPWDDDIDVCMPRPDYMRFQHLVQSGTLDEHRKVICRNFDPNLHSYIIQIYDQRTEIVFDNYRVPHKMGCWLDIFPIDGVETDLRARKRHFKMMRLLLDLHICCITKFGGKRRNSLITVLQFFTLPFLPFIRLAGDNFYLNQIDHLSQKCDYSASEYVGCVAGRAGEKETMKKVRMEPAVLVDFEGSQFYAMANYDEYLTNLYGDYMTPPPKANQISRHTLQAYWKEK